MFIIVKNGILDQCVVENSLFLDSLKSFNESVNCLFLAKPLLSNLIETGLATTIKKFLVFASIRDECDNRWSLTKTRYKNGSTRSHHKEINLRLRVKL